MSELVTSTSAVSQFSLFAPRQQVFVVERSGSAPDDVTAADSSPGGLHSVLASATASRHEDPTNASSLAVHDGPSRARIEIRSLDLGLTPSEVVGTPDVLQRFDNNGDGRVDLLESDKATLSRQKLSTFAAVGGAEPAPAPAPVIVNESAVPAAPAAAEDIVPGEPKKFSVPLTPDGRPAAQKYADTAAASGGAPTGTVGVEKKFYGKGTEVIAGQAVAHTAPATTLHDKVAALKQHGVVKEDGTSEVRLYDKVSQSERQHQQAGGHSSGGSGTSLHERARQIAAAINGSKKTVLIQVAAYTNTAAAATKKAAIVV
ncbi:MAG: hypothetical protein ACYCZX_13865, partial [Rhodospirillaceae bacterium]